MWLIGRPSWQVSQDIPEDLHLILYVRDAYRLGSDGPGRLHPAPTDRSAQFDQAELGAAREAWPAWWASALEAHRTHIRPLPLDASKEALHERARLRRSAVDPPGFPSRVATPALQHLARAAFGAFLDWWSPPIDARDDPVPRRRQGHIGSLGLPGARGRIIDLQVGHDPVGHVVRGLEKERGRKAASFDFGIEVLAINEPSVVLHEPHYAVVASGLVADDEAFAAWLRTALAPLA